MIVLAPQAASRALQVCAVGVRVRDWGFKVRDRRGGGAAQDVEVLKPPVNQLSPPYACFHKLLSKCSQGTIGSVASHV